VLLPKRGEDKREALIMRNAMGTGFMTVVLMSVLALAGCGNAGAPEKKGGPSVTKAVAVLHPTQGSKVEGTVAFTREKSGMRVTASLKGLSPGLHGFHIHVFGDCSAADATSAGDHFNPTGMDHAAPAAHKRHTGDLGNIEADLTGKAEYDRVDSVLTFEGPHSILGRGVIVHAQEDDLKTQPTGGAGARVACGVIGVTK
jgi:Cu-Zn family superoxide dismutase